MAPSPKELDPQNFRRPISLLHEEITEGRYPWLADILKGRRIIGFLIDPSTDGPCVHLVGWPREGRYHLAVSCGDDFVRWVEIEATGQTAQGMTAKVNYGSNVGIRYYEKDKEVTSTFILCDSRYSGEVHKFSFKELEKGFLRAAGRLSS